METSSISTIKSLLTQIKQNLVDYREYHKRQGSDIDACTYGNEKEYSIGGVIGGVKNLMTDIGFLTRSHNLFLKVSTYSERREIVQYLQDLNSFLIARQTQNVISTIEKLKTRIRNYNLRSDKDRLVDYSNALDDLCRKAIELEERIEDVKGKLIQAGEAYSKIEEKQAEYSEIIQELSDKKDDFINEYNTFANDVGDFEALAERAKQNEQIIAEQLRAVKDDKNVFDEFVEKIYDREKVLNKQDESTKVYEQKLEMFDKDQKKKMSEVQELIGKARQALQYTTAAGMSAAFQEQYDKTNDKSAKRWWLVAAVLFLFFTILIGAWIVTGWGIKEENGTQLFSLIGRLSMVPVTISASIFCANQYVKQKNLAEDYAYKAVLTKSIVAFSEELREKDEEGYSEYISTVLKEIHQDPLRKRGKEREEITIKETTGVLGKALDIIQSFSPKA